MPTFVSFNCFKNRISKSISPSNPSPLFVGFTLIWGTERIHVFRPDVECTNGVIHVIDAPFLLEEDVKITGSGVGRPQALGVFAAIVAAWLAYH